MAEQTFVDALAFAELPEKGFVVRTVADTELVFARLGDEVFAVENRCSHALATFDDGRLRGYRLMCPLHGACFDIRTGEPFGPPASRSIRRFETRVEGERVLVSLEEPRR